MDKLIEILDKCLGKDDLSDAIDKYHDFETYRRTTESIPEFLAEFDSKYKKISKLNMTLPPEVLAFKLIMSANIPSDLQMFVKSGMDYSDKTKLYDQAQTAIKKYLTDSMAGAASTPNFEYVAVKTEPIFATSQYRGNYQRRRGRGRYPGYPHTTGNVDNRNTTFHDKDFSGNHLYQNSPRSMNFRGQKGLNSPGPDGSPRRCRGCGSYKHFIANCPHESDSSPLYTSDTYTQNEENFTLFTHDTSVLTTEANIHAVLDSACTSTVCGQRWLDNYLTLTGQSDQDVRVGDSAKIFKFGGGERLHSEGVYKIPAEIVGHSVTITTDVVSSDIPLLLGKEAMKKAKVKLDVENDEASIYSQQVSLDCTSSGHYAVSILPENENSTGYMTNLVDMDHNSRVRSLRKLHLQFGHATSIKLWKLLQNANAWDPSFSTELDNIVRHCDTCKRLTRAPPRPVVAFPMANDFNQLVTMDLKIFRKGYILHIIDAFTRFSVSTFVKHKTPSVIIGSVLKKWISVFGTMQGIFSDNGGEFSNDEMRVTLNKHLTALHSAREEFIKSEACDKIKRALRAKTRLTFQHFEPGSSVYYKSDRQSIWLGPAKVLAQDGKVIFIRHGGQILRVAPGRLTLCESDHQAVPPIPCEENVPDPVSHPSSQSPMEAEDDFCEFQESTVAASENKIQPSSDLRRDRDPVSPPEEDISPVREDTPSAGPQMTSQADNQYDETYQLRRSLRLFNQENNTAIYDTSLSDIEEEVLVTLLSKEECSSPAALMAKKTELEKLKHYNIYEEVCDNGQPRISTRFVMTKKGDQVRARLVARGYEEDTYTQSDSPTVSKAAMRTCLTIASAKNWSICSTDIRSAFLQSRQLIREVFITPPREADCGYNTIWKLNRSLYGLSDAALEFYLSLREELFKLGWSMSSIDNTLFYKMEHERLVGVLVTHIDDFLHSGNGEFEESVMKPLSKCFEVGHGEKRDFTYVGFHMSHTNAGVTLDQNHYIEDMHEIEMKRDKKDRLTDQELTQFRSTVGARNWIVQGTRPDCCFELLELSTKFQNAHVEDVHSANKLIRRVKQHTCEVHHSQLLPLTSWQIVLFTDAAWANLPDRVSSTPYYVVFLIDGNYNCSPIEWKGSKIRRVVRSTLAAETLALQDGLETAIVIKKMLQELMPQIELPISALSDSKSLIENIHSTHSVQEKLLRINIASIKQLISMENISVSWIPHSMQLADCMTKKGASGTTLLEALQSGKLNRHYSF